MNKLVKVGSKEKIFGFNSNYSLLYWGAILILLSLIIFFINRVDEYSWIPSFSGYFVGPMLGSLFIFVIGVLFLIFWSIKFYDSGK